MKQIFLAAAVLLTAFAVSGAEKTSVANKKVLLIMLDGVQPYLKAAYFIVVIGTFLEGVLALALQNCQKAFWTKSKTNISFMLGTISVLLFVISSQPYAAVFAFVLLLVKAFILIKHR